MSSTPEVIYESDGAVLYSPDSDNEFNLEADGADIYLAEDDAKGIAEAILTNLGSNPPALVRASDVSFNEGLLRLAATHQRTVEFRYAKGSGTVIETRSLVPQDVREVGDHLTFIGHDPDRDDVRAYRVDRMKGEVTIR